MRKITGFIGLASKQPRLLQQYSGKVEKLLGLTGQGYSMLTGNCYRFYFFPSPAGTKKEKLSGLVAGSIESDSLEKLSSHGLKIEPKGGNSFTLSTDPVGLLNVYRVVEGEILCLSTSSLMLAALVERLDFDQQGWVDFLTVGYLTGDRTFYRGMSVLSGGVELVCDLENLPSGKETVCWKTPRERFSDERAVEAFREASLLAAEAVAEFSRPCCDLTGGYDSRGIFAMFQVSGSPFEAVVNGLSGSGDVAVAKEIARAFDVVLHHNDTSAILPPEEFGDLMEIINLTDGEIDVCEYYLPAAVHRKTRALGMATVNGSGGELFRGYWWEGQIGDEFVDRNVNYDFLVNRILLPGQDFSLYREDRGDIADILSRQIREIIAAADFDGGALKQIDWLYLRLRMSRWAARFYSSTIRIITCFSPFLFAPLMEVAFAVDSSVKRKNRFYMKWLQRMNTELAKLPLESGRPAVPFSPAELWLFRRVPKKFAGKVVRKLSGVIASRSATVNQPVGRFVKTIFEHFDVNEFFSPGGMVTAGIYDVKVLERLALSGEGGLFRILPAGQLSRLLSLEIAMRHLLETREKLVDAVYEW